MKFSVIIPSYLGEYKNSAKNKPEKFRRAVDSVLSQTFTDYEIIIIADDCQLTEDLCREHYADKVTLLRISPKQPLFSGVPRNTGIEHATGEWIVYLDTDDIWANDHLQNIANGTDKADWLWFDDCTWCPKKKIFEPHKRSITTKGNCGTSNIAHKRELGVQWTTGYLHDWHFIQALKKLRPPVKIQGAGYMIAHQPHRYDI